MMEQLIQKTKRRFYKFKYKNKYWTNELYFNNEKKLNEFIERTKATDVYYSLSKFINKKYIFPHPELVLDFDNVSKDNILKSIEVFGEPKFIYNTSSSHFQLLYENIPLKDSEIWLKKIKENNIEVDESVIRDRECRVARYYPHPNRGEFVPKLLTLEEFKNLNYEITPKEKDTKKKEFYFYKGIKSNINKKDLQVVVIKNYNLSKLKRIQKMYNLGNLYLIEFPKERYAISLKLFSLRRIQKIYKAYGTKFKHNFKFIRSSEKVDNDGKVFEEGVQKVSVLESPIKPNGIYSLPHAYFISHFCKIPKDLNYIGNVNNQPIYEIKLYGNIENAKGYI